MTATTGSAPPHRPPPPARRRRLHLAGVLAASLILGACSGSTSDPSDDGARPTGPAPTPSTPLPSSTIPEPSRSAGLDAIATRYREACGAPGAAVSVRHADGTVGFGTAGALAPDVPLTARSQLLAGSVTKLFVTAVALQLVADGHLDLDSTVDRALPDWPRASEVTVEMLLGHRSGMGDFGNDFGDDLRERVLADPTREYSYEEVLDLVRAVPPIGEPGGAFHYSNANTIVLGEVVRQATDDDLGPLIHDRIAEPLGLEGTVYGPDDLVAADAADLHGLFDIAGDGHPVDIAPFPRAAALTVDPAGAGLISTLPDLLVATHALFAGDDLLAAPERRVLSEQVSTLDASDLLLDDGRDIDGHGGASPGAQVIVAHDYGHDLTVAVWCNRLDPGADELLPSVIAARDVLLDATTG